MSLIVNIFAGPGAGKSTMAAHTFALLKYAGIEAELVREYAKEALFQGRAPDQVEISTNQQQRENILRGKAEVIVTDSPVLLGIVYGSPGTFCIAQHYSWPSRLNVFVERTKPYSQFGRRETEEEARVIDGRIEELLAGMEESILYLPGTSSSAATLCAAIQQRLRYG